MLKQFGIFVKKNIYRLFDGSIRRSERIKRRLLCKIDFQLLKKNKQQILDGFINGYKIKANESLLQLADIQNKREIIIGEFDGDGFLYTRYNFISDIPKATDGHFINRNRNKIYFVVKDGYFALKKSYGNRQSFVNEIKAFYKLVNSNCNIPSIFDIDFNDLTVTLSFIEGKVLREELARQGAKVRIRDVGWNPESILERRKFVEKKIYEMKKYLLKVVDGNFIDNLEVEINKLHSYGIINNDIKYQNIIIEKYSKEPFIIDFENSYVFNKTKGWKFNRFRKIDKAAFLKQFK